MKTQINSFKIQVSSLQHDYDNERIRTADLENKLQTKEEEFEFEKNALHEVRKDFLPEENYDRPLTARLNEQSEYDYRDKSQK